MRPCSAATSSCKKATGPTCWKVSTWTQIAYQQSPHPLRRACTLPGIVLQLTWPDLNQAWPAAGHSRYKRSSGSGRSSYVVARARATPASATAGSGPSRGSYSNSGRGSSSSSSSSSSADSSIADLSMDISLDDILSGRVIPSVAQPQPAQEHTAHSSSSSTTATTTTSHGKTSGGRSPPPRTSSIATPREAARRHARSRIAKTLASRLKQRQPSQLPPSPPAEPLLEQQAAAQRAALQGHSQQGPEVQQQLQDVPPIAEVPAPALVRTGRRRRSRLFQLLEPVPVPIPGSGLGLGHSAQTSGSDDAQVPLLFHSTSSSGQRGGLDGRRAGQGVQVGAQGMGDALPGATAAASAAAQARARGGLLNPDGRQQVQGSTAPAGPWQQQWQQERRQQQQQQQQQQQEQQEHAGLVASSTRQRRADRTAGQAPRLQQPPFPGLSMGRPAAVSRPAVDSTHWAGNPSTSGSSGGGGSDTVWGGGRRGEAGPAAGGLRSSSGSGESGGGTGWMRPSVRRREAVSPRGAPPEATPQEVLAEMAATAEAQRALRAALLQHQERSRQRQQQQLLQQAEEAELEAELARATPQQRQQVEVLRQLAAQSQDPSSAGLVASPLSASRGAAPPFTPDLPPPGTPVGPIQASNWVSHTRAVFPHVYDPSYHTTLYELLFDAWLELGKAHERRQADFIRRVYQFLERCYGSPDAAIRHVAVVSFAEALGDSDSLQATAAAYVQPRELLMDALQPLVQWMHGDELGPGGLVHEFWEAAEARTAPDRRRREAREATARHAATVEAVSRRAAAQQQAAAQAGPAAPRAAPSSLVLPSEQAQAGSSGEGGIGTAPATPGLSEAGLQELGSKGVPRKRGRSRARASRRAAEGAPSAAGTPGAKELLHVAGESAAAAAAAVTATALPRPASAFTGAALPVLHADTRHMGSAGVGSALSAAHNVGSSAAGGEQRAGTRAEEQSEWELLMHKLSALQEVHPAVPKSSLVSIVYD